MGRGEAARIWVPRLQHKNIQRSTPWILEKLCIFFFFFPQPDSNWKHCMPVYPHAFCTDSAVQILSSINDVKVSLVPFLIQRQVWRLNVRQLQNPSRSYPSPVLQPGFYAASSCLHFLFYFLVSEISVQQFLSLTKKSVFNYTTVS